jgi:hypothetical protein
MLNNIVGLKPSLGMVSTAGVVPACRTLDCVSIFSLTVDDAVTAHAAMTGTDGADPFSRDRPFGDITCLPTSLRLGVPRSGQLIFFGDKAQEAAYRDALGAGPHLVQRSSSSTWRPQGTMRCSPASAASFMPTLSSPLGPRSWHSRRSRRSRRKRATTTLRSRSSARICRAWR